MERTQVLGDKETLASGCDKAATPMNKKQLWLPAKYLHKMKLGKHSSMKERQKFWYSGLQMRIYWQSMTAEEELCFFGGGGQGDHWWVAHAPVCNPMTMQYGQHELDSLGYKRSHEIGI